MVTFQQRQTKHKGEAKLMLETDVIVLANEYSCVTGQAAKSQAQFSSCILFSYLLSCV